MLRKALYFCGSLVVLGNNVSAQGNDGYVGVYEDSLGSQPCAAIPPNHGATLYVLATLSGATASGITGAEFRIEVSNPTGWLLSYSSSPTVTLSVGNPLDTDPTNPNDGSGVNLAFAACQPPSANGKVLLGTISAFNLSGSPTDLVVKRHSRPSNPNSICPLFTKCDGPLFSKVCMSVAGGAWCTIGPNKARAAADDDPAVFASNVYNDASGVVSTLPDTVLEGASWIVQRFAAGDIQVRGYVLADEQTCGTLDEVSDNVLFEAHDGTSGQLLIDWIGLHVISRRGFLFMPEPAPPVAPASPAKPKEQSQLTQTLIFAEDFLDDPDASRVPSPEWIVTRPPAGCYWGNEPYDFNPGAPFCSRYIDTPAVQSYCYSFGSGYAANINTEFTTSLNNGNGIYVGNATNVSLRVFFSGSTQTNFDVFKIWESRNQGGWTNFCGGYSGNPLRTVCNSGSPYTPQPYPNTTDTVDLRFSFVSNDLDNGYSGVRVERIEIWGDIAPESHLNLTSQLNVFDVLGDPYRKEVEIITANTSADTIPPTRTGLIRREAFLPNPISEANCDYILNVPALGPYETNTQTIQIQFDGSAKTASEQVQETLWTYADVGHWVAETTVNPDGESDNSASRTTWWILDLPPIILVPGIMGSELQKDLGGGPTVVWPGNRLGILRTLLTQHERLLLTEFEAEVVGGPMTSTKLIESVPLVQIRHLYAPRPAGAMPYFGASFTHSATTSHVWTGTIAYLRSHGYNLYGVDPSPNLFEFHYDWRKQIQSPGTFNALQALIQTAQTLNPNSASRLMVVSHSMGGLVVQGYVNARNQAGQPHGIRSWITLGAPFQGLVDVFGTLLGKDPLAEGIPGAIGDVAGEHMQAIARMSSGLQSLLPTSEYNYVVYERGADRPYPAPNAQAIVWAGTFEQARLNPAQLPSGWQLNTTVYNRALSYHANFTNPTGIPHVYHIVNRDFKTLEKIAYHLETDIPLNEAGTIVVNKPRFDLKKTIVGDGRVPEASALANGEPGAPRFHLEDTRHGGLPNPDAVGEFIHRRARNPNDTTLPSGFSQLSKAGGSNGISTASTHPLVFQFRIYHYYLQSNPTDPPFPVTMEIYRVNTSPTPNAMLVGTYELLENGAPTGIESAVAIGASCDSWSSGDRTQQFWAVDLPDGNYRLVLLPNPAFWAPNDPDPGPFEIRGQLAVRDAVTFWAAPAISDPWPQIVFWGVNGAGASNLGFSAYRDYTIVGGAIQGGPGNVYVDSDGDGVQNDVVTALPDEEERTSSTLLQPFAVQPNPFRESAMIQWSPTLGSPRSVEVYRVDGRRVRWAAVGPNDRSFLWNGRSDTGVQQPAGLYFIRVRDASGRVLGSRKVLKFS